MENQTAEEHFEDQLDHIDELSKETIDMTTSEPPKKPKMTRSQTKAAIVSAIKQKQISKAQGNRLLLALGFGGNMNTKKTISNSDRVRNRKQQKKARKANRK